MLPIRNMDKRHRGLTEAVASGYSEAARVCLDRRHESPQEFEIESLGMVSWALTSWDLADERVKSAWANEIDATEAGAYACVIAAVELTRGFFAVRRAETRTGADY